MKRFLLFFIRYYQTYISPLSPAKCNFYPVCSVYAKEAIEVHGAFYGVFLSLKRIIKCYPFRKVTVDLVPPKKEVK